MDAEVIGIERAPSARLAGRGRELSKREVAARFGVVERTINRWMDDPRLGFPEPIRYSACKVAWLESEIVAWGRSRQARTG